jgi:hypothetical protein
MKNLVIAASLIFCSTHVFACSMSQTLAERYGITFSGFKTPIPVGKAPDTTDAASFIRVMVPDESKVSDGFRHTVVMNTKTNKAWVLRTGGFASAYQWFGPVDALGVSLKDCRSQQVPSVVLASQKQELQPR